MCHAEQLEIPRDQNCRFYEILAPYFRKVPPDALSEGDPASAALHSSPLPFISFCRSSSNQVHWVAHAA